MNTEASMEVLVRNVGEHVGAVKAYMEQGEERRRKEDERNAQLAARLLEIEQKMDKRPVADMGNQFRPGALTEHVFKSEGLAAYKAGNSPIVKIPLPAAMFKAAILNATPLDGNQPLVAPMRQPGIVVAPQRRLFIRELFTQVPTVSNVCDFTRELTFTNAAAPQGSGSSPAETEGQPFNESGITVELAQTPVITLGHWLPASRQVLDDAPALSAFVEQRLLYGLKLEEEDELLNGTGTAGKLNGIIHNATAFAGGSTNMTALDAIAGGIGQLVASGYTPSGIVVSPTDWYSSRILLAKTSTNEYLLGEPADMAAPALWGLPVVVSASMPAGNFLVLDAQRAATIYDREDANMRVSESHGDFFIRGLVAVLVEERLALAVQQSGALIYGSLSYAG